MSVTALADTHMVLTMPVCAKLHSVRAAPANAQQTCTSLKACVLHLRNLNAICGVKAAALYSLVTRHNQSTFDKGGVAGDKVPVGGAAEVDGGHGGCGGGVAEVGAAEVVRPAVARVAHLHLAAP